MRRPAGQMGVERLASFREETRALINAQGAGAAEIQKQTALSYLSHRREFSLAPRAPFSATSDV